MLKHLDLFSGIGGFALAARAAGIETIGFCEIEPYASRILKRHWPDVPNHGDIRNMRGVRADIITGGFPCQPWSNAGKRAGAGDDRHLWPEMLRVIRDTRPAWVLGENVAGLASMGLDDVLADLESEGYEAATLSIPAVALNGRHVRHRLWITAHARCEHGERWQSVRAACDELGARYSHREEAQPDLRGWLQAAWNTDDLRSRGNCDGLSAGVDRAARLRAIGNAIVPAVAYEILKTIAHLEARAEQAEQGGYCFR